MTVVIPLAKTTPDHLPYKIQIGTNIPKANIFRFENYWLSHPSCFELIKNAWSTPTIGNLDSARTINAKFKLLRRMLRLWARNISNLSILIANCNMTIAFFYKLEELRPLSHHEFKFRGIIKRFTQRLVQFGDENTNFFHAMASERYRKNVISQIVDSSGRMIVDHTEKSALFYQEFKSRMGCSIPTSMQYQLNNIVPCCGNLDHLCLPFGQEEIENIILDLPSDKAPGPDGFNNLFFKRAWYIIREDLFKLCTDFFNHDGP
jgi:hypothetical protein